MAAEYLLFDLLVAAGPVALSFVPRARFAGPARSAVLAIAIVAPWFLAWDAAVVGRHWWFDARYVLGPTLLGLPVEEWLFFAVVPYACLFAWETVLSGARARPRGPARGLGLAMATAALLAAVAAAAGLEYTALALAAFAGFFVIDDALGTALADTPRAWAYGVLVVGLTLVCNGYLTARPVVHYGAAYQLGILVGTIPLEDFLYGLALVGATTSVYQWHRGRAPRPTWAARLIERRLGGYRHRVHEPDPTRRARLPHPRRVAVVGGGLAGLSAASLLSSRGFEVDVYERQAHLGGKIGAWTETLDDGRPAPIEHGFHAFFRHYYNLDDWISTLGLDDAFVEIDDYVIVTRDGRRLAFGTRRAAPALNLLDLGRRGLYRLRDVMRRRTGDRLRPMLEYDPTRTHEAFDDVAFADYIEPAGLPADLRLVFNSFARAFFSSHDRLSTAELVKSFHFYYLGHDLGLGYRHVRGSYARRLLAPIVAHCEGQGVRFLRGRAVPRLDFDGTRWRVGHARYDHVVLATDVRAARRIIGASPDIAARDPGLADRMRQLRAGQRYGVLRLWIDRPSPRDLPVFVATERRRALDAVAFVDRIDPDAAEAGGGVVELHCYAVDDDMPDDAIRAAMLDDLRHLFPALAPATIEREHLQLRDDFTAFHVGQHRHRPGWTTAAPGLHLAGDWVGLPIPAMLMEAAHTSARLAVNAICEHEGVRTFAVDTVPARGLLAARGPSSRAA